MRYKLELCYNGTNYHGWQRQPNAVSVQQVLEDSVNLLYRDNIVIVITSYSIHYTKLYEALHLMKPYRNEMKLIASGGVRSGIDTACNSRASPGSRITSYNVCYTKLLRLR